jgi:allophanate hydrolase
VSLRVADLAAAYRQGGPPPVEVAERVHAAASAHAEQTNAWIELVDRDELLAEARALKGGPLYGVPFAIKDNIDLAGVPTTAACPGFAHLPERDAAAVARLRAAGALPIGKTNLDQFATGLVGTRSPYGACSSVFDPHRVSGGSSSGSAVAVADGVVSLALGTDTAGSGRIPAAFNGIVGVKPTRGLVSTAGVVPACRSLDCVSIFAADADGGRRALAVLAGLDPRDAYSRRAVPYGREAGAPLRLGVPASDDGAWRDAVADAERLVDAIVEIDLEPFLAAGRLLYSGPWLAERHAAVGELLDGPGVDPVVREVIRAGARWSAADAFRAHEQLAALRARTEETWRSVDALLVPTAPLHPTHEEVAAAPVEVNEALGRFTAFANLLDLCAVAVPARPRPDGLPFGVTLLAPAFADAWLLDLAARWPQDPAVDLVVCGAHLRGQPLNGQLLDLGARFVRATATAPCYRLYALPEGRPGLVRSDAGAPIEVEVWRLGAAALGRLTAATRAPLAIGTVELADEETARGFVCEAHAAAGAEDITAFGGWRRWLAAAPV